MLKRLAGSWVALVVLFFVVLLVFGELLSRAGAEVWTAFLIGGGIGLGAVLLLRKKYA